VHDSTRRAVHAKPQGTAVDLAPLSQQQTNETRAKDQRLQVALRGALTAGDRATIKAIRGRKMPAHEAVDAAVKLVDEGKLTPHDAIALIDAKAVGRFHLPLFDAGGAKPIAGALGVSDGCASGTLVFDPEEAARRGRAGERVILAIDRPRPEDIDAFKWVAGVISREAEPSAHASVIARELGKPAVASWDLAVDAGRGSLDVEGKTLRAGDQVSIDGTRGELYRGAFEVTTHAERPSFKKLIAWAQRAIGVGVFANADSAASIERAFAFGASGVGLVRTEHMFFGERLKVLQSAILAGELFGPEERNALLARLEKFQQADFEDIFRVSAGRPVTIRLLDPPLHEFLPKVSATRDNALDPQQFAAHFELTRDKAAEGLRRTFDNWATVDPDRLYAEIHQDTQELADVARELGVSPYSVRRAVARLAETNPMFGQRGVRLAVNSPEFYEMQAEALFRAQAAALGAGTAVNLGVLVPMVGHADELTWVKNILERARERIEKETGAKLTYRLGAMIETPIAALRAAAIAAECDFFSFGTNDLTQATYGLSRDDSRRIETAYREAGFKEPNPFATIDPAGVGRLIEMAMDLGRAAAKKHDFTGGICGEQAADPSTIAQAPGLGIDYVSVSPYRVASAILASAQARLQSDRQGPASVRVRTGGRT
jgi:pyruvate, orthophosphate dikinase